MPTFELGRLEVVVGEQKVFDRVGFSSRLAREMLSGHLICPGLVRLSAGTPLRLGEERLRGLWDRGVCGRGGQGGHGDQWYLRCGALTNPQSVDS